MDQLAAKAFSAERRAHIKSLHLARLRVDLPQCAASCNLHIIERQKQPSPWTCIFAGKLCQFFRESLEAKTNSHRFGVFDKKLAYHANGFRGFRALDPHSDGTSFSIMLANFPHHRERSADSAVRLKETIWPDLLSTLLLRVALGLRPPDRDALYFKVRPKEQRSRADKRPRRKVFREICPVDRIKFLEKRNIGTKHLHEDEILHREPRSGKRLTKAIEQQFDLLFNTSGNFLRLRVQPQVPAHIKSMANHHAIRKRHRSKSRWRRKVLALSSRRHETSPNELCGSEKALYLQ